MCALESEEAFQGAMFARGWETCPDRTLQYSYKLPTSSPMSSQNVKSNSHTGISRVLPVGSGETRNQKLESGNWKLEIGRAKVETKN